MKRVGNLWDELTSFDNLFLAAKRAAASRFELPFGGLAAGMADEVAAYSGLATTLRAAACSRFFSRLGQPPQESDSPSQSST